MDEAASPTLPGAATITRGPPTDAPSLPGYAIERQIGRGASATVYLAREVKHDRLVAVKVLHPVLASSILAERFLREIAIIAKLAHPNILPLLDSGRVGDQLFYVTPYVAGESLRQRLAREGRIGTGDAVRLAREVADALDYAHRQGLVHRDVKPENILLAEGHALMADFGIACAISLATDVRLTTSGFSPGTPRYMSPEQSLGVADVDGRADIYSLGCVLYELLRGVPPFTGATPQEVQRQHLSAAVPSLTAAGVAVPASLERALLVALAKRPEERYATAAEFAIALDGGVVAGRWRRAVGAQGLRALRRAGPVPVLLAAGMAAVTWAIARDRQVGDGVSPRTLASLDTTRLVVFPIALDDSSDERIRADALLGEAIGRFKGIALEDQFRVNEAIARLGAPQTARRAAMVAASLGLGRFILVRTMPQGDSSRIYATIYETAGARALHSDTEIIPSDFPGAMASFVRLAGQLLLRGEQVDSLPLSSGQLNLPVLQAFGLGQRSLEQWNLAAADSLFQRALSFDPSHARANLWLAQVRAWRGRPAEDWATLAARAAASDSMLSPRDRALARALVLMSDGEFASACGVYEALRRANDQDFGAWYGLGVCRSRDKAVVRDPSSPTGYRMRSSYGAAVRAYDRALELLPSAYAGYEHDAFDGLRPLLLVRTSVIPGSALPPDTGEFLARLGLLGDTLVLLPYPSSFAMAGGSESVPPGFSEAEAMRTREFRQLTLGWSAAFPNQPGPKHAVAIALEMLGDPSAVDTLVLARRLATDPERTVRLAAKEALLRLKFADVARPERLRDVLALADSIVGSVGDQAPLADALMPLAALAGRCDAAERLSRSGTVPSHPLASAHLIRTSQGFLARAALGCTPGPTGLSLPTLVKARDQERAQTGSKAYTDVIALYRPMLHAWPPDSALVERLASQSPGLPLLVALRAWVRHDVAGARAASSAYHSSWDQRLGPPSPDMALPTARLMAAAGDTSDAVAVLDQALDGMWAYDPWLLGDPVVVASLVRAMALRADLAAARGEAAVASRWGGMVSALWSRADEELQPVVRRMARYAARQ